MLAGMPAALTRPWAIVAAVFGIFTVCSGLSIYSLSVYLHAFVASGRFEIGEASFASSTFMAASGLASFTVGRLIDRHDVRIVMTGGAALMIAALLALPWVDTLPRLFAFHIVLGLGFAGAAIIPGTTIIARWFVARRTAAMMIASTGNSFGSVVLTPPAAMLIAALGLNGASHWLALAIVVGVLPLVWLILRSWPRELGMVAVGVQPESETTTAAGSGDAAFARALRSRYFWFVCTAFLLGMAGMVGGQIHVFNLMMAHVDDAARASVALAVMATASVTARFVAIWLLAHISNHSFAILLLVTQAIALAGMGLAEGEVALFAWIALFGATIGNFVTIQSLVLAEAFGSEAYARTYGLSRLVGTLGVLGGPTAMGLMQAAQHSYTGAFIAAGGAALVAALTMSLSGAMPKPASAVRAA